MIDIDLTSNLGPVVAAGFAVIIVMLLMLLGRRTPQQPQPVVVSAHGSDGIELRLVALEKNYLALDHDLKQMRMVLNHLPTKETVHSLELQITKFGGDLKAIAEASASTARITERLENYLLELAAHTAAAKENPIPRQSA